MRIKHKSLLTVSLLLILAAFCYLPFTYKNIAGERDSFRMVMGIIDSVKSEKPLGSPLLYGRNISFVYYALIDIFKPIFKDDFALILPIMNYISSLSAVLMVIPVFFIVRKYWGITTAILANIFLILIPVWWSTSLYGHPMLQAILLMFVGLALIGYRAKLAYVEARSSKLILLDISIVTAFALCLMFRLDALLMFLLIPGCLILERYPLPKIVSQSILYCFLPIVIFLVAKSQLPEITTKNSDIVTDLLFYHGPDRIIDNLIIGTKSFIKACNPLLIFGTALSFIYLNFRRNYATSLFIFPTIIVNYVFWLPNPYPARHIIYIAPLLAIANAVFIQANLNKLIALFSNKKILAILCSLILFFVVKISYTNSYTPPYPYWNNQIVTTKQLANILQQLPPKDRRIFVVYDSIPLVVEMQLLDEKVEVAPINTSVLTDTQLKYYKDDKFLKLDSKKSIGLLNVRNENNNFVFYNQGWNRNEVTRFFAENDDYNDVYLLIQKLNPEFAINPANLSKKLLLLNVD
ncbi:hypothetical protein [Aliterella atlantica]|uniref:Glycosyltransferase RgtA/B/C/D-like domain-containing protein n=1 Tax=Aliterella atlantica CENA595 TaxID=1618023 RepID=A0A0D8ZR62_9CYAN|nr:hypothetical protein [Aliterella atlantica]KJH71004.1 hypothetical protein UH38_14485 [Aliterella atlantica CENA595]